ncbi:ribosome biogenesis protein [Holotrichia oblita]|uniref:Ribosome biogenesis protein n=1 Tax=Holotrichia oblita TaxID=644536 RepID=A0ACB9TN57_HOLOL|nr:ribosome biogenesis protein [Holotrichia oblita]
MNEIVEFALNELMKSLDPLETSSEDAEDSHTISRTRILNYNETNDKYTDTEFKQHFRMKRSSMQEIIDSYNLTMKHSGAGRPQLTAEKSVFMTVWYVANMECFRQISDRFGVTLSCAYNSVKNVLQHIVSIRKQYIKWPTEAEASHSATLFERKRGLKNIIGAIDGSHIQIRKPKHFGNDYIKKLF